MQRYSTAGALPDAAEAIASSRDSATVFVTGEGADGPGGHDYTTVAYDAATGHQRWAVSYDGPAHGDDAAHALGVSPDDARIFVTGFSEGGASGLDYATVAYDAVTGAKAWVTRYNGPGNGIDAARALGVSSDGSTVFVTGWSQGAATSTDYATAAYDTGTGAALWTARYDGLSSGADQAHALVVGAASRVFVAGVSDGVGTASDYATVAYNAG